MKILPILISLLLSQSIYANDINAVGSFAINPSNPSIYAFGVDNKIANGTNARVWIADNSAMNQCGQGCRVVLHFTSGQCMAYAIDPSSNASGYASSNNERNASDSAYRICTNNTLTGNPCGVVLSQCL